MAGPLVQSNGQTKYKNLIALKARQPVGQWRDSDDGLGGGRYPYDVNTALMPAALRAIANLARSGALEGNDDWSGMADEFAGIWETETLGLFSVSLSGGSCHGDDLLLIDSDTCC